jgi:hypothetical protein
MVKIGDGVQMWLGLETVRAQVIGFSQNDQVIMRQQYTGVNHLTGQIEMIEEVYYRDRQFIESLNRSI